MLKLSVIIPVYNVEPYLRECLESVWNQSFSGMEIICVEDASTDGSPAVLEDFAGRCPQLRVIKHEANKGLAAARNTGMKAAEGKYIWFVDSDDLITPGACKELYETAERDNTDILYFNMSFLNGEESYLKRRPAEYADYNELMGGRELFCRLQADNTPKVEVWRQFFKRDFLEKNYIRFFEGMIHEDFSFSFECAMSAERVRNINKNYYVYRQRENSIVHKQRGKSAYSIFVALSNIFTYWKTHVFSEEENKQVGQYFTKLYKNYQLQKNYASGEMSAGAYPDRLLYGLLESCEPRWFDFSEEQMSVLRNSEYIILYGAGRAAVEILDVLKEKNLSADAVAVTELKGNPDCLRGIPLFRINDLLTHKEDTVILGVSDLYSNEVAALLEQYGFQTIIKPLKIEEGER